MIASLFSEEVLTLTVDSLSVQGHLFPEEEALIANAKPWRRQEFLAGRLIARCLLARLGIHNFSLLAGKAREPLWPQGIVGSLSHAFGICGVAIARGDQIRSLGLDIERWDAIKEAMWKYLFTDQEQVRLRELPEEQRARSATLCFSAKECFYKYQHPITRTWLDFKDVRVITDLGSGRFEVELLVPRCDPYAKGIRFFGRFCFDGDYVFTGMWEDCPLGEAYAG